MHDLPSQAQNLISCLTSKVRSDNPHLKRPTIEVEFDLIEAANATGRLTLHLVARDRRTRSYIYLAETDKTPNRWIGKESEFYSRIFLFVRHILRFLEGENSSLSLFESGTALKTIAKREFQTLIRR